MRQQQHILRKEITFYFRAAFHSHQDIRSTRKNRGCLCNGSCHVAQDNFSHADVTGKQYHPPHTTPPPPPPSLPPRTLNHLAGPPRQQRHYQPTAARSDSQRHSHQTSAPDSALSPPLSADLPLSGRQSSQGGESCPGVTGRGDPRPPSLEGSAAAARLEQPPAPAVTGTTPGRTPRHPPEPPPRQCRQPMPRPSVGGDSCARLATAPFVHSSRDDDPGGSHAIGRHTPPGSQSSILSPIRCTVRAFRAVALNKSPGLCGATSVDHRGTTSIDPLGPGGALSRSRPLLWLSLRRAGAGGPPPSSSWARPCAGPDSAVPASWLTASGLAVRIGAESRDRHTMISPDLVKTVKMVLLCLRRSEIQLCITQTILV